MSDRKINVAADLFAEQGVAVSTTITVDNASLSDIEFENPDDNGVAIDYNTETGEVTFVCNKLGAQEIGVSFIDSDELEEIITITVCEGESTNTNDNNDQEPENTQPPETNSVQESTVAGNDQEPPTAPPAPPVAPSKPTYDNNVNELMRALEEYRSKMDLRALIPTELGISQQQKLFKAIVKVLNKEGADFVSNMNALIGFVKENRKGVFSEKAINRFIPQVKMNKEEVQLFTRLTALLITTADIEDKRLVSQRVDFRYIEQRLRNGKAMHQLINYFNPASE